MRFVVHHSVLLHLAEVEARIADEHELLAPSSSRSHDAVMQRVAWEIADSRGWSTTYDAEYIALTKLQADIFVAMDDRLIRAAHGIVAAQPVEAFLTSSSVGR